MVMKQKILVTGANGQLGKELVAAAPRFSQFDFIFLSKEELPIDQAERVEESFRNHHPQFVINCAAYTAVDLAEEEEKLAFRINAEAPGILAAACKDHDSRFIHISTDYVFDGTATIPYQTDAVMNPINIYGASKSEGEKLVLALNPSAIIIRSSWVYSSFGKNFVKTMLRLFRDRKEINVVNDQVGSPTYAADLAEAILQIISSGQWKPGVFHFSNEGVISWYDFARQIREITGSNCIIHPIPASEYPTPAKRPAYSALDSSGIQQVFGIRLRNWKDSLNACLLKMKNPAV